MRLVLPLVGLAAALVACTSFGEAEVTSSAALGRSGACASRLSAIGVRVAGTLQADHAKWEHTTWDISCDNELGADWLIETPPASSFQGADSSLPVGDVCWGGDDCNLDFNLKKCPSGSECTTGTCTPVLATVAHPGDSPQSLCLGHSDFTYDRIYGLVVRATSDVTMASLDPLTGPYLGTLRNALTFLGSTQREKPLPVRLLVGTFTDDGQKSSPEEYLAALTRDLGTSTSVVVSTGTYGGAPMSFNHTKMIVADGREAIVGGHTWLVGPTNLGNPVHDVSLEIHGNAATSATREFDYLWSYARAHGTIRETDGASKKTDPTHADAVAGSGKIPVIGVGTTGATAISMGTDQSGDEAIFAMIDAARSTVRIDQQDLVSENLMGDHSIPIPQHLSSKLVGHLVDALKRGVDVHVLLGSTYWWNGWTIAQTAKGIGDAFVKAGGSAEVLCSKLHIAAVRDGTGALVGNHAKVVIADDQAFYLGSQNLYPGDLSDTLITSLADFGYVVDDAPTTRDFVSSFWTPAWTAAASQAISGSEAKACIFDGAADAKQSDCSSGWSTCGDGVCSWNGAGNGYCCKAKWTGTKTCYGEGDNTCGPEMICAQSTSDTEKACTTPNAQPCLN